MESLFPQRLPAAGGFRAPEKGRLREAAEAYFLRAPNYEPLCLGQTCLAFYRLFSAMPSHRITLDEAASADRRNSRLSALIRFVDENYSHKILLSDFARREGCSMSYLSHFVKETLNQNFQQYVNAVRLNAACKLIATTDKKLLDVSLRIRLFRLPLFLRRLQAAVRHDHRSSTAAVRRVRNGRRHVASAQHPFARAVLRRRAEPARCLCG